MLRSPTCPWAEALIGWLGLKTTLRGAAMDLQGIAWYTGAQVTLYNPGASRFVYSCAWMAGVWAMRRARRR